MAARSTGGGAKQRLMAEMAALQKEKWVKIDVDEADLFHWHVALMVVNSDSAFNGGYFKADMSFTDDYPFQPPRFRFITKIIHPNIYPDGQTCISILHKPGPDQLSGEDASERWSPLQGVESVLRSVLLLLDDPEINSPANVDASVLYRDKRAEYYQTARETVERSKKEIPEGFEMPTSFEPAPPPQKIEDDDAFWVESDDDFDFGGSDTGDEDEEMQDFEEDGGEQDASDDEES